MAQTAFYERREKMILFGLCYIRLMFATDDLPSYASIHNKLIPSSAELRHIPIRIYLPANPAPEKDTTDQPAAPPSKSSPVPTSPSARSPTTTSKGPSATTVVRSPSTDRSPNRAISAPSVSHLKVVQVLVPPFQPQSRSPQTLGTALHGALPSLFPSRRAPIVARPVLHGAVLPMETMLEDLMRVAAYLDGWLHLGIEMIG